MLSMMDDQLKANQAPTVTNITIVVIEPKHLEERPIAAFTNNAITMIPIVRPVDRRINSRADCTASGHVDAPLRVREYWSKQVNVAESAAATRIKADFQRLVRWP